MPIRSAVEQAIDILKHGAIQPTSTFRHLVQAKAGEAPWLHRQRVLLLLKRVGKQMDYYDSDWKLVRVSKQGQDGLYQFQKRERRAMYVPISIGNSDQD